MCAKMVSMERTIAGLQRRDGEDGLVGEHHEQTPEVKDSIRNGFSGIAIDPALGGVGTQTPVNNEIQHIKTQGIHTQNELTGEIVHLGGSSVPALIMALGRGEHESPAVRELLGRKSILPIFGLDNESATYPFVDLWGIPHGSVLRAAELAGALPNDQECLNFFRYYRETAQVVYPAVADVEKLEADLLLFLLSRANAQADNPDNANGGITEHSIYAKNLHWIGLLFATLASGCQCSALPRKERDLTSQVYVCCSFECLRFTNFLSQPTLETIQTLLILGNVISNNMNAGISWSLLGLTIRLAQSLGLHRSCPDSTPAEVKRIRSAIWWSIMWQDNMLSITYDRASSTPIIDYPVPTNPSGTPGARPYVHCMYRLCKCGLEILRDRAQPQNSNEALQRITEHRNELQNIMMDAADYLKDSRRCRSMRDQLEHWALYLHISYVTSELCRPAISPATTGLDLTKTLRKTCLDSLANTVEAFLGLQNMTVFASRSWAAVHRAISSALLLGILGEASRNERARMLVGNLVTVLTEITSKLDPAELSAPISRSIGALRKLINNADRSMDLSANGGLNTAANASATADTSPLMVHNLEDVLNWEDSSYGSQSPFSGIDFEQSPYGIMDTIMWGAKKSPNGMHA